MCLCVETSYTYDCPTVVDPSASVLHIHLSKMSSNAEILCKRKILHIKCIIDIWNEGVVLCCGAEMCLVWCVNLCIYLLEIDFQHRNGNVSMVHCVSAEGSILLRLPCIHTVPLCGKTQTQQQLDTSLKASVSILSKCLWVFIDTETKLKTLKAIFNVRLHINMHKILCRVVSTMLLINLYMNLN